MKTNLSTFFIISSLVINGCTGSQANEEFPELIFRNQPELLGVTLGFGSFSFKLPKTYDQLDTLQFDRLKEVLSDSENSFFENELLAAFTDEDISILLVSKVNTKDALLKLDEAYSDYQLSIPGAKSINRTTFSLNGINIIQYEISSEIMRRIKLFFTMSHDVFCLEFSVRNSSYNDKIIGFESSLSTLKNVIKDTK